MLAAEVVGAILAWKCSNLSIRKIKINLKKYFQIDVGKSTIAHLCKTNMGVRTRVLKRKFRNRGHGSGRTFIIPDKTLKKIVKYVHKTRGQKRVTTKFLKKMFELPVCTQTVLNNLIKKHKIGWMRRRPKSYPSKRDKDKRMRFARALLRRANSWIKRIVFFDGSTLYWPKSKKQALERARGSCGSHVLRTKKEGLDESTTGPGPYFKSQGGSAKYWGVLGTDQRRGAGGAGMFFASPLPPQDMRTRKVKCDPKKKGSRPYYKKVKNNNSVSMTEDRFKNWVSNKLTPWCKLMGFSMKKNCPTNRKPILIFDHERCLRTKKSILMLKRSGFLIAGGYPVGSPDLNAIENVWHLLKDAVYDVKKMPPFLEGRNNFTRRVANEIKKLAKRSDVLADIGWRSMKTRAKDVIALNGNRTRW